MAPTTLDLEQRTTSAMRPNFLFILTDQHRAQDLGCYGNRIVSTPHIDALAARGLAMDRAYVATPVCMPNRSTLLTGRLPSLHGVRSNGIALSLDSVTFADLLGAAGYRTALVGKSHLQNFTGLKALVAGEAAPAGHVPPPPELAEARARAEGDYLQEDLPRWRSDEDFDVQLPFYGFRQVDLAIGHADEVDGHYGRWLRSKAPELDARRQGPSDRRAPGLELVQSWDTELPEELYPTTWVAERTIARIEEFAADPAQPFFLYCSFPDPHHPFTPPGRYRDMYRPEDMPLPASWDQAEPPAHVKWLHAQRDAGRAVKHTPALYACTEREAREATALTYGMVTMVDDAIGRIVAALERTGQLDNTVIVFTTDHGEYLGDHQLMLKGPIHYQSVIRTPLIWCDPAAAATAGRRSAALTGTLDLARTVLERAGVAPANGMQGRSLQPVIEGRADAHHDAVLIEDEVQRTYLGFDRPVRMRTLVTPRHRFSVYLGADWGELYDLEADPHEMRNLWADPAHAALRAGLFETLAQRMIEAADRSRLPTHLA